MGGSSVLEQDLYEASFCFVPWDSYTGAERAYAFDLREDQVATFTLDSPCSDLDLVLMRWEDTLSSPTESSLIAECDADVDPGNGTLTAWNNVAARYLIVVDGKDGAEDNFTLGVSCWQSWSAMRNWDVLVSDIPVHQPTRTGTYPSSTAFTNLSQASMTSGILACTRTVYFFRLARSSSGPLSR